MDVKDLPRPLQWLVRGYVAGIENLLILGMVGVVVLAALQVFFRYVLGASLSWSEEALRYLMIWITYLGIGLAYSRGEMIGMELLVTALPRPLAIAVGVAGRLLVLAMMLTIFWFGVQFAWETRLATAVAIPVSMFWFHISVAVGAALIILHVLASAVSAAAALRQGKSETEEAVR